MNMTTGAVNHDCWPRDDLKATRHKTAVRVESVWPINPHPVFGGRGRVRGIRCDGTIIEWTVNSDGEAVD